MVDHACNVLIVLSGDVILSINGVSMENADHETLVSFIRNSGTLLRLYSLFNTHCVPKKKAPKLWQ